MDLAVNVPSQTPNWDIVCDIVNLTSRTFRSARQVYTCRCGLFLLPIQIGIRETSGVQFIFGQEGQQYTFDVRFQCRDRYLNMIIPREEGKIPLVRITL